MSATPLSPGEQKARPDVIAMGGEVVWNLPNNTYMRMQPLAAIHLASQLIAAADEALSKPLTEEP